MKGNNWGQILIKKSRLVGGFKKGTMFNLYLTPFILTFILKLFQSLRISNTQPISYHHHQAGENLPANVHNHLHQRKNPAYASQLIQNYQNP